MKLTDIQKAITRLLKSSFPTYKISVDSNKEDIKAPTFFVSVRPLKTENYMVYKNRLINVTITYVNKSFLHEENLDVIDSLEAIFNLTLDVLERHLLIKDLTINETDELLNCSFTLDFIDENRTSVVIEKEKAVPMQELNLNI